MNYLIDVHVIQRLPLTAFLQKLGWRNKFKLKINIRPLCKCYAEEQWMPNLRKADKRYKPLFWHLMNFDFYQLYKDYSNIELLKIVKRPTEYQPTAVAVATQILNERQLTTEEIQLVD